MKILILNGSPRLHGNTSKVVRTLDSILAQEHTVELLDICSMQLSGCVACDACKQMADIVCVRMSRMLRSARLRKRMR